MALNKKLLTILALFMLFTGISADNGINSPYSRFGMGILSDQNLAINRQMGGLGYAMYDNRYINLLNPAAIAHVDTLTMLFEAGFSLQNVNFKENSKKINAHNAEVLNKLSKHYNFPNLEQEAKQNDFIKLAENIFVNQDIEFTWPDLNCPKRESIGKCYALRKQIAVLVNGDVVPCCLDGDGILVLGNINESSLEEILSTPRVEKMIRGFENHKLCEELCQTCGFAQKLLKKI